MLEGGDADSLQISRVRRKRVSKVSQRSFADVQAAFASGRVLDCSRRELEELLVATASATPDDPAVQACARELAETLRQLLQTRSAPRRSKMAAAAFILALAALLISAMQAVYSRAAFFTMSESAAEIGDYIRAANRDEETEDPRTQVTIEELARRAPTLSTGTLQAWWAGEQARRVQRLEALAKRQTLAGDHEGAARTVKRADAMRTGLEPLARFERPAN